MSLLALVLGLLSLLIVVPAQAEIVCQDLQDEILCSEAKKAGNCEQMPWNGKCRKTCGRCGRSSFSPSKSQISYLDLLSTKLMAALASSTRDLDECYDAENLVTCEDEMEKGNCGDEEVAHICSKTCNVLACNQQETQLADAALR